MAACDGFSHSPDADGRLFHKQFVMVAKIVVRAKNFDSIADVLEDGLSSGVAICVAHDAPPTAEVNTLDPGMVIFVVVQPSDRREAPMGGIPR
jgi:hypothetical protein